MIPLLLLAAAHAAWEPPGDVAEPFNAGIVALREGHPDLAEEAFREALLDDPACGRCAHGLGIALVRQQRLAEAQVVLAEAAGRYPQQPELQVALAGASFATQDFDAALIHARRAVQLDGDDLDAQVVLQQALLRLGRADEARLALAAAPDLPGPERTCFELMIGLEQGALPGTTQLAYCKQAQHPGLASTVSARLGAAEDRPSATATASPDATSLQLVARALALHQRSKDREALPILDQALELEPRRVDARILRAVARARTGQLEGALADLRQVLDAESWVEVHRSGEMSGVLTKGDELELVEGVRKGSGLLVSLLVEADRLAEAEQTLTRARVELGEGPRLAAGEVRLRSAQGRLEDAWAVLGPALTTWPDDGDLALLTAELAARDPGRVPAGLAQSLDAAETWRTAYYRAQAASKAGRHSACVADAQRSFDGLQDGDPPPTADDRTTVLRLLHTCAVNAGHLTAADRAADALGHPGALRAIARVNHALMREDAGDHQGALDLLLDLEPPTEQARSLAGSVTVYAAGELQHWSRALAAAPAADADVALWLAVQLKAAGLEAEARQAVQGRCGELDGAMKQACEQLQG